MKYLNLAVLISSFFLLAECFVLPEEKAEEHTEETIEGVAKREYDTVHGRILAVNMAHERNREIKRAQQQRDENTFEKIEKLNENIEKGNKADHVKMYQGDIVLTPEQEEEIRHQGKGKAKRNAVRGRTRLWIDRVVPYVVPSHMNHIYSNLQEAMNYIQSVTCLRFVPRSGQSNYIYFTNNNGCSSKVGKMYHTSGFQELSLANGCNSVGTILHELLHALGFWHEQARADRDKFVKINWEYIQTGFADQFDKYTWATIDDLGKNYDYDSIMHYSRTAFTKSNGYATIQAIDNPNRVFGPKNTPLSNGDIIEINALYDCQTTQLGWTSWTAYTPCDNNCYKSRERYCYHSGDLSVCGGNVNVYGIEKDTVKCPVGECPAPIDGHWGAWTSWGACAITCGDGGAKTRSRVCNNPAPQNAGKACLGAATENTLCVLKRCHLDLDDTEFEGSRMGIWSNAADDNFDWTLNTGVTGTALTGPNADHTSGLSTGYYMYIESSAPRVANEFAKLVTGWQNYVAGGQCFKFYYHMHGSTVGSLSVEMEVEGGTSSNIFTIAGNQENVWKYAAGDISPPVGKRYKLTIKATVGNTGYSDIAIDDVYIDKGLSFCQDTYQSCGKWAGENECQKNWDWMSNFCRRSCKTCPGGSKCSDEYDVTHTTPQCKLWAGQGNCASTKDWMEGSCCKSCFICGCEDEDSNCETWRSQGECTKNTAFMTVKCRKSCKTCSCHDYDTRCEYWASIGECPKNAVYMKTTCPKSCGACNVI